MSSSNPKPYFPGAVESDLLAGTLPNNNMMSYPKPEPNTHSSANINHRKTLIEALMGEGDGQSEEEVRGFTGESPPPMSSDFGTGPSLIATIDAGPFLKSDSFEGSDVRAPAPEVDKTESSSESRPIRRRRRTEKAGLNMALVSTSPDAPDWLPAGWRIEQRVRESGASAGSTDTYFYDPVSARQFRSKNEVLSFLETGVYRKRTKANSADPNNMNNVRKVSKRPLEFDFFHRPAKVKWVLEDSVEGHWTPFIGERKLPEFTRQEWGTALDYLDSGGVRDGMFKG